MASRILIVEDNELNLKLFCDLLRAHNFEVEPVRDGRGMLERAQNFMPELIIMDIQLPHVSGLELITQLKKTERLCHIPVMAVTAYAAPEDEQKIRQAGATSYIAKPISVIRFLEAVKALI
ncbi:MAG: response regulator [Zymomonas mobilis subsp. pomaceae]|uniref:Response regulator receiver protein n=1 Tax=Zymomonas mobilis subsp. pomaceae (strain ATCC 29192 / DSM 22645 / JCM 10191 / CCUG 17912 / NBRC 13757 / NCIMB 11200 / NRRL B-4491 / Barker I) TaxID=579138 RepID=F8ESP6_ZYMMT|nr:response regulator [Zymomonas mobilis]AEI37821.1 response regulator receiver protein [Zymomonas mobilis subsp. pomaceae ATCC 29192]MDX5949188.1 response regulator [Zymomonas mobilis subsp. pomaceae]GEB89584.1 response regulator [Zymomonas mobilis subsp. pomaceae]